MKKRTWLLTICLLVITAVIATFIAAASEENKAQVVYLYQKTCGFCKEFTPKLDTVQKEFSDMKIERIDVQSQEGNKKAMEWGATVTPTLFIVKSGKVLDRLEGDSSEQEIRAFLKKSLTEAE